MQVNFQKTKENETPTSVNLDTKNYVYMCMIFYDNKIANYSHFGCFLFYFLFN